MPLWTRWYVFAFSVAVTVVTAREVGSIYALNESEWAAWVQAVGSIGAILVAVWVSHDQNQQALRRSAEIEASDTRRMLLSLADEMESLWAVLASRLEPFMGAEDVDKAMLIIFTTPAHPFSVYDSHVHRIGVIADPVLRQQLITTYVKGLGLLATFSTNSDLVRNFEAANILYSETQLPVHKAVRDVRLEILTKYGKGLRLAYRELETLSAALVLALRTYATT
jgi:hypothetical protein